MDFCQRTMKVGSINSPVEPASLRMEIVGVNRDVEFHLIAVVQDAIYTDNGEAAFEAQRDSTAGEVGVDFPVVARDAETRAVFRAVVIDAEIEFVVARFDKAGGMAHEGGFGGAKEMEYFFDGVGIKGIGAFVPNQWVHLIGVVADGHHVVLWGGGAIVGFGVVFFTGDPKA